MPKILIGIVIKNNEQFMKTFLSNLLNLSYPKEKITLCILESDSEDKTWEILQECKPYLKDYQAVHIWKHDYGFKLPYLERQERDQDKRYRILGEVRTEVVTKFLTDEEWVFSFDADLQHVRTNIIEKGLEANKIFLSFLATCFFKGALRTFNVVFNHEVIKDVMPLGELPDDLEQYCLIDTASLTCFLCKSEVFKKGISFKSIRGKPYLQEQSTFSLRMKRKSFKMYLDTKNRVVHF